jgi:hypothetical protein
LDTQASSGEESDSEVGGEGEESDDEFRPQTKRCGYSFARFKDG